jgi:hypothetical protein
MEPSWTSPIPQAMQQHRGTQLQKPKDTVERAGTATPVLGAQPGEAAQVQKP